MTTLLFHTDAYRREFEATVVATDAAGDAVLHYLTAGAAAEAPGGDPGQLPAKGDRVTGGNMQPLEGRINKRIRLVVEDS